jgi:hypothetical protein
MEEFTGDHDHSTLQLESIVDTTGTQQGHTEDTTGTKRGRQEGKGREQEGKGSISYHPDFLACREIYPKRFGGDPKKAAFQAWTARRRSGTSASVLQVATEHYRQHCDATGKTGTEYVMQGATFYGPKERWKEFVDGPGAGNGRPHANTGPELPRIKLFDPFYGEKDVDA